MTDVERKTFCAALSRYGAQAQITMVFEEMAELQDVLCKFLRGRVYGDTLANIAEEIADVKRDVVMKGIMAAKWMDGYDGAMAMEIAASAPAADDVAPVVHGHRVDDGGFYARCSQCDGVLPLCANYCPNCGAKMDGGDSDACVGSNDFCSYGERREDA